MVVIGRMEEGMGEGRRESVLELRKSLVSRGCVMWVKIGVNGFGIFS